MDDVDGMTVRAEGAGMHTFSCSFGARNGKTKSPACPTAHILVTICQQTADTNLIKELPHNCIAHQDYTLRGKINVEEFEDRLVFLNEGAFIPVYCYISVDHAAPIKRSTYQVIFMYFSIGTL